MLDPASVKQGRAEVENEYARAVSVDGNVKAQELMCEVFELRDTFEWRGSSRVPNSALKLRAAFADFDAELRFPLTESAVKENPACQCPAILRGAKSPEDCKLFGQFAHRKTRLGRAWCQAKAVAPLGTVMEGEGKSLW